MLVCEQQLNTVVIFLSESDTVDALNLLSNSPRCFALCPCAFVDCYGCVHFSSLEGFCDQHDAFLMNVIFKVVN